MSARFRSLTSDDGSAGVLLLSASSRILHINQRARLLLNLLTETQAELGPESLPSLLREFCHDLLSELTRRHSCDWAEFELRRVCHLITPPLLLRGFAVRPTAADHPPHMMLTVQAVASG